MSKELLLKELIHIQENGPTWERYGICNNLSDTLETLWDYKGGLFSSWSHFTGDEYYPVPHPDGSKAGYVDTWNKWTGEYGELRKDLLDHMINTLKEELEGE